MAALTSGRPVPSAPVIREHDVEEHLRKQCLKHGFMALKFTSPARNGVPDRVVVAGARTPFVELKKPGKKPRRLQLIVHEELRAAGAEVHVIDSLEGVDALIASLVASLATTAQHDDHNQQKATAS